MSTEPNVLLFLLCKARKERREIKEQFRKEIEDSLKTNSEDKRSELITTREAAKIPVISGARVRQLIYEGQQPLRKIRNSNLISRRNQIVKTKISGLLIVFRKIAQPVANFVPDLSENL